MLTRFYTAFCTVLLLLAMQPNPAAAVDVKPIKIGAFLAVTGPASFLGDPQLKTMQMLIANLNARGGVNGRPLELIYYDTGGNAREAANWVKQLIKKDGVDLIIGGTTSSESLAVIPEVEKEGIPFISLAAAVTISEPPRNWVFQVAPSDRMAVRKIFADMRQRGISKIALLSGDGSFDQSGRSQILKLAPEHGITLVADESYANKDTDMTAQLNKIRGSAAQAILVFGFGQAPALLTKSIRQSGITLPLYHSHGVASQAFLDIAGSAAEGVRLPVSALLVAEQLADSDPQKPILRAYKRQYQEQHSAVSSFGGHGYDGLILAKTAIERAGSIEKSKVREEIEKTQGLIGTTGIFNFSPQQHNGLSDDALKMVEIRNGIWTIIQ